LGGDAIASALSAWMNAHPSASFGGLLANIIQICGLLVQRPIRALGNFTTSICNIGKETLAVRQLDIKTISLHPEEAGHLHIEFIVNYSQILKLIDSLLIAPPSPISDIWKHEPNATVKVISDLMYALDKPDLRAFTPQADQLIQGFASCAFTLNSSVAGNDPFNTPTHPRILRAGYERMMEILAEDQNPFAIVHKYLAVISKSHKCQSASCHATLESEGRKFGRCGGCSIFCYCGAECQKNDWQGHKRICKMVRAVMNGKPPSSLDQEPIPWGDQCKLEGADEKAAIELVKYFDVNTTWK